MNNTEATEEEDRREIFLHLMLFVILLRKYFYLFSTSSAFVTVLFGAYLLAKRNEWIIIFAAAL